MRKLCFCFICLFLGFVKDINAQNQVASIQDSLEKEFENGAIVEAKIIALHEGNRNEYVFNERDTLSEIRFLKWDSCADYYRSVRKMIPAEEVKIFDLVWSIKEIRAEVGKEGGSGYHQIFMVMDWRPEDEGSNGFYRVTIKRSYENRWGRVFPIGFVYVKLHPLLIQIEVTKTGEMVELEKWRKLPDDEKD